jgi:D-ribitol-5-phosphate cytidylyltransferase
MKTMVMLMFGGKGERLGAQVPKQYIEVAGKPLFAYSLESLNNLKCINQIIAISNQDYLEYTQSWIDRIKSEKPIHLVSGGNGRSQDIVTGLDAAREIMDDDDIILFYDAVHPFVDEAGIESVIQAIQEYGAATLAEYQYDTTYQIDADTDTVSKVIPRACVIAGASPEGFTFGQIYNIYKNADAEELSKMTSAGAIALSHEIPMKAVRTSVLNLKITFKEDLELFGHLAQNYCFQQE